MKRFRFLMVRAGVVGFRDERRRLRPIRFIRLGNCMQKERERGAQSFHQSIPVLFSSSQLLAACTKTRSDFWDVYLDLERCDAIEQDIMMWQSKLKCSHSNSGAALMCVNILAGNSPNLSLYRLRLFSWIHPFTNPISWCVFWRIWLIAPISSSISSFHSSSSKAAIVSCTPPYQIYVIQFQAPSEYYILMSNHAIFHWDESDALQRSAVVECPSYQSPFSIYIWYL